MEQIVSEDRFPWVFGNPMWGLDNVTDGTMYNIAASGYDLSPFEEAFRNLRTIGNEVREPSAQKGLLALDRNVSPPNERISYGRYWHGYQVPLRISSIFLSLRGLRVANSIALLLLLLVSTVLISRRIDLRTAVGWVAVMIVFGVPAVPLSLQFVGCFYIVFLTVIAMCLWPKLFDSRLAYFIVGGITSYIDFLTVPLITLGLPLILAIVFQHNRLSRRRVLVLMVCWCAGYASIWMSKWLIRGIFFAEDTIIADACHAGEAHLIFSFLPGGFTYKFFVKSAILILSALSLTIICYTISRRRGGSGEADTLMLVAMLPFAWDFLMMGHTIAHIWFTYRNLIIPTFACLVMLLSFNRSQLAVR